MQWAAHFLDYFKKDKIAGLDLGSASVKLACFSKKEGMLQLHRLASEDIENFWDEKLEQKGKRAALKKLLQDLDLKKIHFVVNINCPRTLVRKMVMPSMPKAELEQAIRLQAKNYFPVPIEQAILDFETMGEVFEKGVKKIELCAAVSPKETIQDCLSLLGELGVRPQAIVSTPYALKKLNEFSSKDNEALSGIVDIGATFTELVILKGRRLVFSRKIPVAGHDFTKAMTEVLLSEKGKTTLSLAEAERIKKEIGIPAEEENRMIQDKISTRQIISMLRQPAERLVSEIDRSLIYYREEAGGERLESLTLLGGGASLKGLPDFISKGLGVSVQVEVSAKSVSEKKQGLFAAAIGAALTEGKRINLLPREVKEGTSITIKRTTWEVTLTSVLLVLAFFYIGMRLQLGSLEKKIAAVKTEFASLGQNLRLVQSRQAFDQILSHEPYWGDVLKELSSLIPSEIYLTQMAMAPHSLKIKGAVISEARGEALASFVQALEKGIFHGVKLISSREIQGKSSNEFELEFWVDSSHES